MMAMNNFMQSPGANLVPGCDILHVAGARKPGVMGRVVTTGDFVVWDSASAGMWSRKEGRVIEVVPSGCRPQALRSSVTRDHESYVVQAGDTVLWPTAAGIRLA